MINLKGKDSVADAVKSILQQEEGSCVTPDKAKHIAKKEVKKHEGDKHGSHGDVAKHEKEMHKEEKTSLDAKLINTVVGDKPEETPARKSIKAHGGEPIEQPKIGFAKEEKELSPKQKAIAKMSPPKDKIDSGDLAKLRAGHKPVKEDAEQLDEKKWIAGAIKKPGALHKQLHVPAGEKIPAGKLEKASHAGGKLGQRARLAKTLKGFKEQYEENSIYDQLINEVLSKDATAGDWIHDFVHSDNPKFAGKSKEMRKKMALAAYYAKQRNEEIELDEGLGDKLKAAGKKALEKLGHGSDEEMRKDLQKKMGVPQTGKKPTSEEIEHIDEKLNTKKKTMDTLGGRVNVPDDTHNQHTETKVELNSEGWDDMLKAVKARSGPQPSGGSGVKKGSRYGGSKQKDKPEQDDDKKKVNEAKRPEDDSVPFDPPYNTTSRPAEVTDKSGATHTPMSRAKHLAKLAMKRVKTDLGQKGK